MKLPQHASEDYVLNGHSESLHLETKETISEEQAISVLQDAPGLKLHHGLEADDYPTATTDADGDNLVSCWKITIKDLWSNNRINHGLLQIRKKLLSTVFRLQS